jgi:hypothetical protein
VDQSQLVAGIPTHRLIETSLDYGSTSRNVFQQYKYVSVMESNANTAETLCLIRTSALGGPTLSTGLEACVDIRRRRKGRAASREAAARALAPSGRHKLWLDSKSETSHHLSWTSQLVDQQLELVVSL